MSEVRFTEINEIKKLLKDLIKIQQQQLITIQQNNDLLIQFIEELINDGMIDEEEDRPTYLNSRS